MEIAFEPKAREQSGVGVLYNFQQVVAVDRCYAVAEGIVLVISLIEVYLCQICGSGSSAWAADFGLNFRQVFEGEFQVVGNELPALVVVVDGIFEFVVLRWRHVLVDSERNVLVEAFEQEVSVSAQETHFGNALLAQAVVGAVHFIEHFES